MLVLVLVGCGPLTRVFSDPQLVSSNVSSYQHTSVSLEFFETVVRYDKFFTVEPQHIPAVLVRRCARERVHAPCV